MEGITNHAENFIWIFKKLRALGYKEINLNLGCPSGTVTAKGRGLIADPSLARQIKDHERIPGAAESYPQRVPHGFSSV